MVDDVDEVIFSVVCTLVDVATGLEVLVANSSDVLDGNGVVLRELVRIDVVRSNASVDVAVLLDDTSDVFSVNDVVV